MANREQRNHREAKKPKKDKAKNMPVSSGMGLIDKAREEDKRRSRGG
jgi:hypothetical protein